ATPRAALQSIRPFFSPFGAVDANIDVDAPPGAEGRPRRAKRWAIVGAALVAVVAAVVTFFVLRPSGNQPPASGALACTLATPAANSAQLSPGALPKQNVAPPETWRAYEDPSGVRIARPDAVVRSQTQRA